MCVPKSELQIFDYLVEFEINSAKTSINEVINEVGHLLGGNYLPFSFDQVAEIIEVDMTTVCSLNGAEYHCWCEGQYFWPCEKCTLYGPCANVTNTSCGCINALPNDGHFCQPASELTYNSTCPPNPVPAEYLIEVEIGAIYALYLDFVVNYLKTPIFPFINISEVNITTGN
ncbi:adhesion G protein-coupled receptor F5-like [Clarias gariepinus]